MDGRRGAMAVFSRASVASCPAFRLTRRNLLRRVSASNPREHRGEEGVVYRLERFSGQWTLLASRTPRPDLT